MTLISYGFSYYIDKLFLLPHRHVRILKDLFDFKFWVVAWTLDSSNNQLLFMMFLIYILENPKITRRKLTRLNNVTWLMTSRLSIYGCELFKSLRKMETDSQNCLSPKLFAPKFTCRNLIWDKVEISLRIKLGAFSGRKDWEKNFQLRKLLRISSK